MRTEADAINHYLDTLQGPRGPALDKIETELKSDGKWGINIGTVEGVFLQFLMRAFSLRRVLEIGTQYGCSTQWMLEALPPEGSILTIEKEADHYDKARSFIRDPRVKFVLADAVQYLSTLAQDNSYDLVFIDANKKAYPEYLTHAKRLLKPGGFLLADNTFLFKSVLSDSPPPQVAPELWHAMREFNQRIFSDPDFVTCLVPTSEGLTLAHKN